MKVKHSLAVVGMVAVVAGVAMAAGAGPGTADSKVIGAPKVGPEVPVTAMDVSAQPSNNSPLIVADPTDSRFLVMANRLDAPGFSCALQTSGDGGRGWVTAQSIAVLPAGVERCYAPEAAFDARGTLHYSFVGLKGAGNEPAGVFLISSSDRARTWSAPRRVLGPRNYGVRMTIDPSRGRGGRIHLVWLHATSDPPLGGFGPPPNPIMAAHSDDGGKTFSSPVQVSQASRLLVVAPSVAIGPDGALHVAYYDLQDDTRDYLGLEGPVWEGTWSVVVATSTDGGRRFGDHQVVNDAVVPWARPMLIYTLAPPALVGGRDGGVCAAWTDARHGDADAMLACRQPGAAGWGRPRRLNDDTVGNGRSQYLPQLGLSPRGRLDAVFYDRRADPENVRADVFYTYATSTAAKLAPNLRLTRDPSDTRIGQRYTNVSAEGQAEVGSRLGMLSRSSGALAAWADTRNHGLGTAQDIFAANVAFARSSPAREGARIGGAALAGAGILGLAAACRRRRAVMHPGGVTLLAAGAALPLVMGGCASSPAPQAAPSGGPAVVDVTMSEYGFEHRAAIPAGRVVFRVHNAGRLRHSLDLVALEEDVPPIGEQLRGSQRRPVAPFGYMRTRAPGQSGSFAVDLVAGQRYAMLCFVRDEDGRTHAVKGMNAEFRAAGKPTPVPKEQPPVDGAPSPGPTDVPAPGGEAPGQGEETS